MREFVNEMADRLHLPPVFWEPPIDYRQDNLIEGDGRNVIDEQRPRARYLYGIALVASVAVHGALLAYAIKYAYSPEPLSGVSPTSTAAISIELSDTNVLESLKNDGTNNAAQAAVAMSKGGEPSQPAPQTTEKPEPVAPPSAPAEAAETAPAQPEPQQMAAVVEPAAAEAAAPEAAAEAAAAPPELATPEPADEAGGSEMPPVLAVNDPQAEAAPAPTAGQPDVAPTPTSEPANAAPAPTVTPTPEQAVTPTPAPRAERVADAEPAAKRVADTDAEPEKPTRRRHSRRGTRQPANAPGITPAFEAAGSSEEPRSSGRASASRGQTIAYRSRVQSHLAGNKPSGGMGKGTVRIAFALSPGGGLVSARIAHSSGNRALDQAALAAVYDATPFPSPPPGISASQLRFSFPFYFR